MFSQTATTIGRTILFAIPVTIMFNDLVGSVAFVAGPSMQPALNPTGAEARDVVLINKLAIKQGWLNRGDVIVLDSPQRRKQQIVKRLIGLPGDWVKTRSGELKHVPKGKVWIEGDNQEFSCDSDRYGAIPISMVRAKVSTIVWPPSRWGDVADDRKDKQRLFISNDQGNDFPRRRRD